MDAVTIASIIAAATPLVYATLGETITEKAGIVNLSLDGTMLLSAMVAFAAAQTSGSVLVGFAAAALQLADRDEWIGWYAEQRREYLQYVVGMSRFLIRPSVQCRNLASKTLSMSMAAFPDDFERQFEIGRAHV